MIHLNIAYYNQPRPALQSAFRTKNRLLPYQPHCEPHSVRKNASYRTKCTANRIPYEKTPHPILFFPTKFPLSPKNRSARYRFFNF